MKVTIVGAGNMGWRDIGTRAVAGGHGAEMS
jgi:hypothetical protein